MLFEVFRWATPEEVDKITREAIRHALLKALQHFHEERPAGIQSPASRRPPGQKKGRKESPRGAVSKDSRKGRK
jgi:hypothetical protein